MSLISYLMIFTRAASCTKSKGLPIDIPYHLSYTFYTRSTTYKKAKDSRWTSLIIYLMFFTCTASRTKSKGLPIDVTYHLSYAFYMHNAAYKKQGAPN
jgi:hypothetical protein